MHRSTKKSFYFRLAFCVLAIVLIQWNLACTSKKKTDPGATDSLGDQSQFPLPTDPFAGDPNLDTGLGGQDDLFLPLDGEEVDGEGVENLGANNPCVPSSLALGSINPTGAGQFGGTSGQFGPTGQFGSAGGSLDNFGRGTTGTTGEFGFPEGFNSQGVSNSLNCVQGGGSHAFQLLLSQALNTFEHMGQCYQQLIANVPGPDQEFELGDRDREFLKLHGLLLLTRCFRLIHRKISIAIPWVQAIQARSQEGDQQFVQLLELLKGLGG